MTLLLAAFLVPLITVNAGTETQPDETPVGSDKNPGIPDNALQYNKTEITPVAQMEQVVAGEPTLFQYRNTTMLMNCTKNCDLIFTVAPEVTPKLFGFSIDPNQSMALAMNLSGSPLEGATVMERTLNFYLGIEPNATVQLSAQLRLHINQTKLSQELNREVNASRLTWMYWNTTALEWTPVESYVDPNGYLVCNTDHFSTWTVAELPDAEEQLREGIEAAYIYAGVAVVFLVLVAVGIVAFKIRR